MSETTRRDFIKKSTYLLTALGVAPSLGLSVPDGLADTIKAEDRKSGIIQSTLPKSSKTMTLFDSQGKVPAILIDIKASSSEKLAARELKTYLEEITDKSILIRFTRNWTENEQDKYITIGHNKLTDNLAASGLTSEQYIIDVTDKQVAIIGGNDRQRGVLYGVYDFLEQLGVRWYRPEPWGEHVPHMTEINLTKGQITSKRPTYEYRSVLGGGFTRIGEATMAQREWGMRWALRNHLNGSDVGNNPAYGGRVEPSFAHVYYKRIPVEKYFDEHPEYFCLYEGKRRKFRPGANLRPGNPTGLQLCISNPEVQELFAQDIIAEAHARAPKAAVLRNISFSATPNDAAPFCECDVCKAMDDPAHPRSMSNRVAKFTNIVARKVAKEIPGAMISLNAYSSWEKPPTIVEKMEPNILIHTALINALADYTKTLTAPAPNWNLKAVKNFQKWRELGVEQVFTYEYWDGYGWKGPLPLARTIADRIKGYRQYKVNGVYNSTYPSWGPEGLDLYMCAKLLWNPDLDVNKELDAYYENYYGPASKPMKRYHEMLMDELEGHSPPVTSGGRGMHLIFTPKVTKKLGAFMQEAQETVKDTPLYKRRLFGVWAGYEVARRVSEILVLKAGPGSKEVTVDKGSYTYLQNPAADKAYDDLINWMHSIDKVGEDAVFDLYAKPPYTPYMKADVLENAATGVSGGNESKLLRDFK